MAELGRSGPVALLATEQGVIALALDGRREVVVPGAVDWAMADARSNVLWYERVNGAGSELWLLDLGEVNPVPELVLRGLRERERLTIAYADTRGVEVIEDLTARYDGAFRLTLALDGASLTFEPGLYDAVFDRKASERWAAQLKPEIVSESRPRLVSLAARGATGRLTLPEPNAPAPARALVDPKRCEDPELCGKTEPLGASRYVRALIAHECGDACHVRYELYDPRTREFIDPATQRRSQAPIDDARTPSLEDAWVSRDGRALLVGGSLYELPNRSVFAGVARGGGFLGGAVHVD